MGSTVYYFVDKKNIKKKNLDIKKVYYKQNMSSTDRAVLKDLASDTSTDKPCNTDYTHQDMYWGSSWVWCFIIFIIVWLVIFFIIVSCEPDFLRKGKGKNKNCKDDCESSSDDEHCKSEYGAALLYSFLITLVIFIIIWVLFSVSGYTRSSC